MKPGIYACIILMMILSSCFTEKNIMKHKQPLSVEALKSIKYSRVYIFYFKNGLEYKVRIESIGGTRLSGTTESVIAKDANGKKLFKVKDEKQKVFDFEYNDIIEQSNKVTRLKFNPYLTFVFLGVTVSGYIFSQIEPIPSGGFNAAGIGPL